MSSAAPLNRTEQIARWQWPSLAIGAIALAVCILGGLGRPSQFFRAYLPAWLFYWGLALGSMAILMIYHLIGGAWGFLLRRILEAGMRTLPLVAVLFVPIAAAVRYIYPWAQPDLVAESAKLKHETFYLNAPYFWMRAAAYFVLWLGMAFWLGSWSRRQDQAADPRLPWKCEQLSAFGAVIYGVTLHFAAIDWAMSLLPAFHSTIWGPLFALGQLLSALAFALIVLACKVKHTPRLADIVSPKAVNDMGSLLLTFLIAWAYMAWFQFMLIWIANLPVDIIYYLPRASTAWLCVIWAIVILHFVVPFFLLLMRPVKRSAGLLAWTAGLILLMQLVFMYYQITPTFDHDVRSTGFSRNAAQPPTTTMGTWRPTWYPGGTTSAVAAAVIEHWMDFLMPIALGGIWLSHFLRQVARWPLLVEHDAQRATALHLRRLDDEEALQEEALAHE
jgi:hypothetical protein